MGPDVLRRVRWGNVALAAAAAAALVAVVAWPRLTVPPPALPSDSATPLVRKDTRPAPARPAKPAPRVKTVAERPPRRHRARTRRARRRHPAKRRARMRRHARAPHRAATPAPPKVPAPVIATTPPPRATGTGGEFGFER